MGWHCTWSGWKIKFSFGFMEQKKELSLDLEWPHKAQGCKLIHSLTHLTEFYWASTLPQAHLTNFVGLLCLKLYFRALRMNQQNDRDGASVLNAFQPVKPGGDQATILICP